MIKVLVIGDNSDITDMLSLYLESLGKYECKVLNDGKEGLEWIRQKCKKCSREVLEPIFKGEEYGCFLCGGLNHEPPVRPLNPVIILERPIFSREHNQSVC